MTDKKTYLRARERTRETLTAECARLLDDLHRTLRNYPQAGPMGERRYMRAVERLRSFNEDAHVPFIPDPA